jgi:hypothetical protein
MPLINLRNTDPVIIVKQIWVHKIKKLDFSSSR